MYVTVNLISNGPLLLLSGLGQIKYFAECF